MPRIFLCKKGHSWLSSWSCWKVLLATAATSLSSSRNRSKTTPRLETCSCKNGWYLKYQVSNSAHQQQFCLGIRPHPVQNCMHTPVQDLYSLSGISQKCKIALSVICILVTTQPKSPDDFTQMLKEHRGQNGTLQDPQGQLAEQKSSRKSSGKTYVP